MSPSSVMSQSDDDRFAEVHAAYLEAWHAGLDAPETPPASAAEFTARLEQARRFFELARTLGPQTPGLPEHVGHFVIRRELGRGGFGIVFLAHHPTLRRDVALKVPRPETLVTPELRARFLREARAAALLDHPNIVPVHDAGENGAICWIASRFIDGPTLRDWLAERGEPIPPMDAARLAAQLAEGLQHAHERGVLHCDVKPGNVLLEEGRPRLADFGLAKLLDADEELTQTGQKLGTPAYMAPEQALGRRRDVSPATDVWSLGVVLMELLTGEPSADVARLRSRRPDVSRDLEAVVLKCLERDPSRRYASAGDLAEDLGLVSRGEPPRHARPVSRWRLAVRWARRHMAVIVTTAALLTAIGAIVLMRRDLPAQPPPPREEVPNSAYVMVMLGANAMLARKDYTSLRAKLAGHRPDPRMPDVRGFEWRWLWHLDPLELIVDGSESDVGQQVVVTSSGECVAIGADRRVRRWNMQTGSLTWKSDEFPYAPDAALALSADGTHLAAMDVAGGQPRIRLWEVANDTEVAHLPAYTPTRRFARIALSPRGDAMAFGGRQPQDAEDSVTIWVASHPKPSVIWRGPRFEGVAFSADGSMLAIAGRTEVRPFPEKVVVKSVRDFTQRIAFADVNESQVTSGLAFTPDGRDLFASDAGNALLVFPFVDIKQDRLQWKDSYIFRIAMAANADVVACAGKEHVYDQQSRDWLSVWDRRTRTRIRALPIDDAVTGLAVSADGKRVLYGTSKGLASVPATVEPLGHRIIKAHQVLNVPLPTWAVAFSPNGKRLASCGEDRQVRLWDPVSGKGVVPSAKCEHGSLASCLAWAPDGSFLVSGSYDTEPNDAAGNNIKIWEQDGQIRHVLPGHAGPMRCLAVSRDGKRIASGCKKRDFVIRLWHSSKVQPADELVGHANDVNSLAFIDDNTLVSVGSGDKRVLWWDLRTKKFSQSAELKAPGRCLALSSDKKMLAVGDDGGNIYRWRRDDAGHWNAEAEVLTIPGEVFCLAFSPDNRTLVSGGQDKILRFWQASSGTLLVETDALPREIHGLSFSPDGERLAAAVWDGTIRIWHAPRVDSLSPFLP